MPFTPYHMGPGLGFKVIFHKKFSILVFGWSQIVMDLQPLYVLTTGRGHFHGISHTLIGATFLGLVATISGKYFSEWGLWLLRKPASIGWKQAATSALVGTFSHVLLDSFMHRDLFPLWPFSSTQPLMGWLSYSSGVQFCFFCGVVFGTWLILKARNGARSS